MKRPTVRKFRSRPRPPWPWHSKRKRGPAGLAALLRAHLTSPGPEPSPGRPAAGPRLRSRWSRWSRAPRALSQFMLAHAAAGASAGAALSDLLADLRDAVRGIVAHLLPAARPRLPLAALPPPAAASAAAAPVPHAVCRSRGKVCRADRTSWILPRRWKGASAPRPAARLTAWRVTAATPAPAAAH